MINFVVLGFSAASLRRAAKCHKRRGLQRLKESVT
jgi:hypothetical protein